MQVLWFVSAVIVIPDHPKQLLSGSGGPSLLYPPECPSGRVGKRKPQACLYSEIHLFQIDTGTQRLEFKETVRLAHNSWDVAFDESAGLWVLQQNKVSTATLYRLREGHWQCAVEDPKLKMTVDILCNHWDMFQESRYHNLYKSVFDNMAAYLLKKEERIEQQGKRMKGQLPESSGAKNI
ncbi:UNVERIFIED_CONTAM: hypothetical protein FKN15_040002 [Acipenser sinensis]